jgi:hypothetical protein
MDDERKQRAGREGWCVGPTRSRKDIKIKPIWNGFQIGKLPGVNACQKVK